ncbi:MAG TPA: efflux RND transporter permease subunit, partial [Candidatus Acidoferrum sp.]|nr:efflux RND transporter permease subunit [Candidatus Acidoferrum sp.]
MNISELFIKRPIMTTLVMTAILLFGVLGYRELAVSELPNIDYPTIQVGAALPGANPDTMASSVATPLEKQFSAIAGIDSMTSTSSQGATQITLQFDLSRNIDGAAQDVQEAIARAQGQLPTNMPAPPTAQKVNPAAQPIYWISLSSPTLPYYVVDQYAETLLAQRISMVKGVAQVEVFGSQKYAVRVQLDPQAMASKQLGIDDVTTAIQNANVNLPTGTLYGNDREFNVQANGQLNKASLYRPLIVAYRNGSPVRLDELGNVVDSVQISHLFNILDGHASIVLGVQRQPGTNTVEVVNGVKALLPSFEAVLPPSVSVVPIYDDAQQIRDSINDVKFTLLLAMLLVVLVIFLFLRNLSATVIPSIALPISLFGTFAVMYELGYTVDSLSLMAL